MLSRHTPLKLVIFSQFLFLWKETMAPNFTNSISLSRPYFSNISCMIPTTLSVLHSFLVYHILSWGGITSLFHHIPYILPRLVIQLHICLFRTAFSITLAGIVGYSADSVVCWLMQCRFAPNQGRTSLCCLYVAMYGSWLRCVTRSTHVCIIHGRVNCLNSAPFRCYMYV